MVTISTGWRGDSFIVSGVTYINSVKCPLISVLHSFVILNPYCCVMLSIPSDQDTHHPCTFCSLNRIHKTMLLLYNTTVNLYIVTSVTLWTQTLQDWLTFDSKCCVTTSFKPVYRRSPCLWRTIVCAFLYSSTKLRPELFFFSISCIAFFNKAQMLSTYFLSIVI